MASKLACGAGLFLDLTQLQHLQVQGWPGKGQLSLAGQHPGVPFTDGQQASVVRRRNPTRHVQLATTAAFWQAVPQGQHAFRTLAHLI